MNDCCRGRLETEKATTKRYSIRLTGEAARGARVAASVLRELSDVLLDATRGALRLRVEGRSTARGSLPAWLTSAADFDLVGIEEGSTALLIEAQPLSRAAPGQFQQQTLFHPIDPTDSALDLMEQSLVEAVAHREDSELLDQSLLATFHQFERTLSLGFSSIDLGNGRESSLVVRVNREVIETVDQLRRSTPPPQRVRVSGKLDTIRHSDRMFTLLLDDGHSVKGVAYGVAAEQLASLFGANVVVSGEAVFRASGKVLRLDAGSIEGASEGAEIWSRVPTPLFHVMETAALLQPQGSRSGVNAIIGRWPGNESDDEIAAALAELS